MRSLYPRWCPRCAAPVERRGERVGLPGGRNGRLTVACTACHWALAIASDSIWQRRRETSATTAEAHEWRPVTGAAP